MKITYDCESDAAYIRLTEDVLDPGRDSLPCPLPDGAQGHWVVLDWKDGKITGMEVLDASRLLHADLLGHAELI